MRSFIKSNRTALRLGAMIVMGAVGAPAWAQSSTSDAFSAGQAFATTGSATAGAQANASTGSAMVPNFTTTAPESANYGGGKGNLWAAGVQKQTGCQGYTAPNGYAQQECDAVNFLSQNTQQRPKFTISKNDPLLQGSDGIIANPGPIPGASSQQCRVVSTTTPATTTEEHCTQAAGFAAPACTRTLQVIATAGGGPQTCSPANSWINTGLQGDSYTARYGLGQLQYWCGTVGGSPYVYFRVAAMFSPPGGRASVGGSNPIRSYYLDTSPTSIVVGGCGGCGSMGTISVDRCDSTTCTITLSGSGAGTNGTVTIAKPITTSGDPVISKSWDNQCTNLEQMAL